jgi:beta-exotoxin I transport system ATP-binding protein
MPPAVAALSTEGLTKYYGRVVGCEDLNLTVAPGETFGFLGANGSGKTTTIRLILGLLHATRGRALVDGLDCRREGVRVRGRIGYLPAEIPLYPELSGAAYLRFLGRLEARRPDGAWMQSLLHRFDVSDIDLSRPMGSLSHGMKRKFGIIQALMGDAPLLVLDEPTSGLDPLMIEAFAETITALRVKGRTVFLSSHVLSEVEKLCDRIALVSRGHLVKVAALAEIHGMLPRRLRVTFTQPVAPPESLPQGVRVVSIGGREWRLELFGPAGPLLHGLHGLPVEDVEIESATLEEYVLGLYSAGQA